MKTKSQVSLEFLFTIGIVLLVFILLVMFNFERQVDVSNLNSYVYLKSECFKLSSSITNAYVAGQGVNLTARIDYDAYIFAEDMTINFRENDIDVYCSFPLSRVTNSTASNFYLRKGMINIQNINQTVVVKNA